MQVGPCIWRTPDCEDEQYLGSIVQNNEEKASKNLNLLRETYATH